MRIERSRWVLVAMAIALVGCEAAPLSAQSTALFAMTSRCDPADVTATQEPHRAGASYERFDVRGCGRRQLYVCATDVGCMRPEEVPQDPSGGPGTTFPPTLVDQAPPTP